MNNLETIISQYAADERVKSLQKILSTDQPGKAQLKNAVGGQVAFLLAALTQEKEGNTVFI
ncbi:MAG: hypothetical protein IPH36_09365 [Saprospiraceae bacterium]|nr:hypothetical protein [Saprospiraceae bacterium]